MTTINSNDIYKQSAFDGGIYVKQIDVDYWYAVAERYMGSGKTKAEAISSAKNNVGNNFWLVLPEEEFITA